ncbi:hypothetical protein GQ53DRAFT_749875 [Thozetella sp. PMI_491]|nr:hypothetical protein GQ53DRAFT_749875 [Thozetella sp. PMI_491]
MSATATITMATLDTSTMPTKMSTAPCCPSCGSDLGLLAFEETQAALADAQKQIADLQAQVRLLNQKATAAVDRWADYEDELAKLRSALKASSEDRPKSQPAPPVTPPQPAPSPARSSFLNVGANRLSQLLSPRKSAPSLKPTWRSPPNTAHNSLNGALLSPSATGLFSPAMPLSPTPSTDDLMEALSYEQSLRLAAEGKLSDTSREVEELSVSLFEQANEMVATERRARAKLAERVEVLEKRDFDKRKRLDTLESAMGRIERVRDLLGQTDGGNTSRAAPTSEALPPPTIQEPEPESTSSTE